MTTSAHCFSTSLAQHHPCGHLGLSPRAMCPPLPPPQGCSFSSRPQLAELWFRLAKGDTLRFPKDPEMDQGRVQQPSDLRDRKRHLGKGSLQLQ